MEDKNIIDCDENADSADHECTVYPDDDSRTSSGSPVAGCFIYTRGMFFGRKCRSNTTLIGKTVLITGGNSGIGKETALDLARRGAKVIIACRDTQKGDEAIQEIQEKVPDANISLKQLDLASFASIRKFSEEILNKEPFIHILINNAGIAACPKSKTEDGFEMQFGVNHLGHFLLTMLLLDRIKASAPARIINVASLAHIYTGVTTYCLHPGAVHTGLGRHIGSSITRFIGYIYNACSRIFFLSPQKGAQTTIYCAVEDSLAEESGFYYVDCSKVSVSARARDDKLAKKLWDVSENLINS